MGMPQGYTYDTINFMIYLNSLKIYFYSAKKRKKRNWGAKKLFGLCVNCVSLMSTLQKVFRFFFINSFSCFSHSVTPLSSSHAFLLFGQIVEMKWDQKVSFYFYFYSPSFACLLHFRDDDTVRRAWIWKFIVFEF